jgi:hypothetical protein
LAHALLKEPVMKTMPLAVSLTSLLAGSFAYADNADDNVTNLIQVSGFDADHHVAAPAKAIEIGVTTGYTRGVGPIGAGMQRVEDIAKDGASVELDATYRIDPTFAVGIYYSLSKYAAVEHANTQTDVLGATAGLQAIAHLRPERSVDPWMSVGAGWRGLLLSSQATPNGSLQGLELARLQLGVDYRVTEDVAIAPVIGGSLNLFVTEEYPGKFMPIDEKKLNFIGFAGLAGRFDFGGSR